MAGRLTSGLGELAERALERMGDHRALVFEGVDHSAVELHERATRLAGGLVGLGIRPDDRVAVCMTNTPDVLVSYAALWRCGAVPTPVVSAVTPVELQHVLTDSEAVAVIADGRSLPLVTEGAYGLGVRVLLAGPDRTAGVDALLDELETAAPVGVTPRTEQDMGALLYTGGTTGRAKGVVLSHGGLAHVAAARAQVLAQSGAADLLLPLPLSHVYGLLNAVTRWSMAEPGFVALQRRFDAADWVHLVEQLRPQSAALVPSMLQLLLRTDLKAADLSSLRHVTSGGAPLAVSVLEEFERRVPRVRVCDGYGCTEVTSTATMNPWSAPRPGSVGLPVPGVDLRIVDELDQPVPAGVDGEVCVRSPGVMTGYWRSPQASAEAVRDGWLHTGDVGHLDQDGYLYVVDRLKDLIIRGGFNVYPRDVEDVLLAHPAVASAAVVGRPDDLLGEEVVAFVSLSGQGRTDLGRDETGRDEPAPGGPGSDGRAAEDALSDALVAWCRDRLGRHKHPREVRIVGSVPLASVGKTDRKALRRRLVG